jgi:hypothetical protein
VLVPESDPHGWALKALRESGNQVLAELRGLDEDALCRRPEDDDRSLKEIAAHLRDAGDLALKQVEAIRNRPDKTIPWWDTDLLLMERDYRSEDLTEILYAFRAARQDLTALLWTTSRGEWDSAGRHPYRGHISIGTIAGELARHDLEHLWQMRRLKSTMDLTVHVSLDPDW